ncbi:MAG: hypothetical protein M1812_007613 [Candelaria pacifica]|nr:MAG: hypothetical protein M1812_007613 [Candelaria pacifica]
MSFTSAPQAPSNSQPTPTTSQHWRHPTYSPSQTLKPPFASSVAHTMAAPLSSPSTDQPNQYFTSASSYTSHPPPRERDPQLANNQIERSQGHSSSLEAQQPQQSQQAGGSRGSAATTPFLRDFNLVAEAAKRAQMAVIMRDLDGVSLT